MQLNSFLTFNGNCREAMIFYQRCLGGQLSLQAIGESPLSEKLPKKMKACILNATLRNGSLLLMGSDMVPEIGLIKGNAISLTLICNNEIEIRKYYKRLAKGGQATHPLAPTFEGVLFGSLVDKYGHSWLLHFMGE